MSPKNNHPAYLAYFREALKDCTPAVAIAPERYAVDVIDYHYRDPATLQPLPSGKQHVLKMEADGYRLCHYCGHYRALQMFGTYQSKVTSFNPCGYDSYCRGCRSVMAKKRKRGRI